MCIYKNTPTGHLKFINEYLITRGLGTKKAFRHVGTLFVQGNQVRTDQNKPSFLLRKKQVCFDQYDYFDYLRRIKFLHIEMPHRGRA